MFIPSQNVFEGLDEPTFMQWKHHPLTAGFFRFMRDQRQNWKDGAMALWENGNLDPDHKSEDLNSNVIRGKVLALAEMDQISLYAIQQFYREASQASQE